MAIDDFFLPGAEDAVAETDDSPLKDPLDIFGGKASAKASEASLAGTREGIAEQRRQFDITEGNFRPFREAGLSALGRQQALLGFGTPEEQQAAIDAFQRTPGQTFLRDQQERALLRNASAIGGLGGGNIRTALQENAFNRASTEFGTNLNRLAGISGTGQTATRDVSQFGQNTANNVTGLIQQGAQQRASGIQAQQQAKSNTIQTGAGLAAAFFSDVRLKENIVKTGEVNGHNWYTWDWTEEAKLLVGDQPSEGVIAQEVYEDDPQAVRYDEYGYLTVDYEVLSNAA